jgi:sulfite reductase (ferredoxin)
MLLVTRGVESKTENDVFNLFIKNFIEFGFVEEQFRNIVTLARDNKNHDFISVRDGVSALSGRVRDLYNSMDDSLQFKAGKAVESKTSESPAAEAGIRQPEEAKVEKNGNRVDRFKDLRGVACPMNFVQTKIQLATMQPGQNLEIFLDDGQPIDNVPGSVRNEGHQILEQEQAGDYWKVLIKKK